jgi:hypothetical protein
VKALLFSNAPDKQKSIALFERSEVSYGFPSDSSSVKIKMSMGRRRNDSDRRIPNCWERKIHSKIEM